MAERPIAASVAGRFDLLCHRSAPARYPEEAHETVQMCLPLDQARYRVRCLSDSGRPLERLCDAADNLVIPAHVPHEIVWLRDAWIVSLHLHSGLFEEIGASAGAGHLIHRGDALTLRDPLLTEAAAMLRTQVDGGQAIDPLLAESFAVMAAWRVLRLIPAGRRIAEPDDRRLSQRELAAIETHIADRLDEALSVTEMAAVVGLSPGRFMRCFRATTGLSPWQHVIDRRLEEAKRLLRKTDLSMTAIALSVGMSQSHLNRVFRQRVGCTPSVYRGLASG